MAFKGRIVTFDVLKSGRMVYEEQFPNSRIVTFDVLKYTKPISRAGRHIVE